MSENDFGRPAGRKKKAENMDGDPSDYEPRKKKYDVDDFDPPEEESEF